MTSGYASYTVNFALMHHYYYIYMPSKPCTRLPHLQPMVPRDICCIAAEIFISEKDHLIFECMVYRA